MWTPARQFVRRRPGRDLPLLFSLTILLPGLVLSAMTVWALSQQQTLAGERIQQRLDAIAARVAVRLDRELDEWRSLVERIDQNGSVVPAAMPSWIIQAASIPGTLAIIVGGSESARIWPEHGLSHRLDPAEDPPRARRPRVNRRRGR